MAKREKDPKPGDVVVVQWLDSGAYATASPDSDRPIHLYVKTTCGRVHSFKEDDRLKVPLGTKTLILTMCSYGGDDERSELAAIWGQSIVHVTNYGPLTEEQARGKTTGR